jgi:RES domain-containing protein
MILYRIAKCNYIDDLTGTGARLYGGRWNSVGKSMVYTASTRALALLEVLVHLPATLMPANFCIAEIEAPNESILEIKTAQLPLEWQNASPSAALQQIGNLFLLKNEYLILKVPSVIVQQEYNMLINPLHPLFSKLTILNKQPFAFDHRLL